MRDADQAQLDVDYAGTKKFLVQQTKKDPRAKPKDFTVEYDHKDSCTLCENEIKYKETHVRHPSFGPREHDVFVLADDFLIHQWKNVRRFTDDPIHRAEEIIPTEVLKKDGVTCRSALYHSNLLVPDERTGQLHYALVLRASHFLNLKYANT